MNEDYQQEPQNAGFAGEGENPDYEANVPADGDQGIPQDPFNQDIPADQPPVDEPPMDQAPVDEPPAEGEPTEPPKTDEQVAQDMENMPAGTVVGGDMDTTTPSGLPGDEQAGTVEGDFYSKYDFQGTYDKMKSDGIGPEGIIGIVLGVTFGMALCFLCVCVCWIRQRNIHRAKYGYTGADADGGQIEM
ncbi:hypothetical protein CLOM_g20134 [Closterium sp. NIES-68]|nr:hypothetical protein CLOM_g20134 [Closterium sp. NIES-68]GJP68110.1 hypothetical protein CLOP_g24854 [Closterium sp. NIES-67]